MSITHTQKSKPHLILVHSFPTNSILLHGLEEFLSDFFTVHFINLPGFHKDSPPFNGAITLDKFSHYINTKISELDIDRYVVGGISFGFLVVNNMRFDDRCKAVLAMEPFLNIHCLNMPIWKRKKYMLIATCSKIIRFLGLEKTIWTSSWFNSYLQKELDYSKNRMNIIAEHVDPRTFFTVAELLLTYKKNPTFHALPYFLIGNFADKTINFGRVVDMFAQHLHELHIISEPIDHYPRNLTKRYFQSRIPHEHIERMLACIKVGTGK